jgi:catechol 2,3-dioxygenase-like lactoylglutathione lyase family enzyme
MSEEFSAMAAGRQVVEMASRRFTLEGIDHVAIAVRDVELSAAWYCEVLGLERRHRDVWGSHPAIVGIGTTSVALFPVAGSSPTPRPGREVLAMRHLAFRASRGELENARAALAGRGIAFTEQDHEIARSIYFEDPDGHEIEITTYEV